MIGIAEAFSPRYAPARQKFLQACVSAGLTVEPHAHPLKEAATAKTSRWTWRSTAMPMPSTC